MNDRRRLDDLLGPDPRDVGCDGTLDMLDVYLELALAGGAPEERYPGVAAHLRDCGTCADDLEGLRLAVAGA